MTDVESHRDPYMNRTNIVAAMQAAILAGNWLLADKIARDHFDLNDFQTDPCRWCGRDAQANMIWWGTSDSTEQYAIPLCNACEHFNITCDPNIFRTCRNRSWRTQKPGG